MPKFANFIKFLNWNTLPQNASSWRNLFYFEKIRFIGTQKGPRAFTSIPMDLRMKFWANIEFLKNFQNETRCLKMPQGGEILFPLFWVQNCLTFTVQNCDFLISHFFGDFFRKKVQKSPILSLPRGQIRPPMPQNHKKSQKRHFRP